MQFLHLRPAYLVVWIRMRNSALIRSPGSGSGTNPDPDWQILTLYTDPGL
jgi:hypothetical protein